MIRLNLYSTFYTCRELSKLMIKDRVAPEGHMDAFTLVDTFGVLSPHGAAYFARKVRERVTKPIEIHFHSDFGLGVANTIMAVLAGAEVIHSTITGIGERAGNTPMEETVLTLLTMYGIDAGIDFSKLNELSRLVRKLSGTSIPESGPFIGDGAYNIESGIPAGWYRDTYSKQPTLLFPLPPEFVGHEPPQIMSARKANFRGVLWLRRQPSSTCRCSGSKWIRIGVVLMPP